MWDNPVTPMHPDKLRVSWGQSAETTTRGVSFAILRTVTIMMYMYIHSCCQKGCQVQIYINT